MKDYIKPVLRLLLITFFTVGIVSLYINYENNFFDFINKFYLELLSISGATISFLFLFSREMLKSKIYNNYNNTPSDEKRLLDKKRQFLDSILDTLKLDIDKDLKKILKMER